MGVCTFLLITIVAAFPQILVLTLLIDAFRQTQFASTRTFLFITLYLLSEAYGVVGAAGLWFSHKILKCGNTEDYISRNYELQWRWAYLLVEASSRIFNLTWHIEDDPKRAAGPALIFMRHSSLGDTLMPIRVLSHPYRLRLRYVLKKELLWDPSIDIVGQRLSNFFVDRQSKRRMSQMKAMQSMVTDLKTNEAALIYPEGTRATPEKRNRIIDELERTGKSRQLAYAKSLKHLLPPRLGGAMTFLASAPKTDVIFCAHHGFEGAAQLSDLWHDHIIGKTIRVKFWRVPHTDIPTNLQDKRRWFLEQWASLDTWVQQQFDQHD